MTSTSGTSGSKFYHLSSVASSISSLQELQKYEQFIFADHTSMIHVENVYEEILQEMLVDEALRGEGGGLPTQPPCWGRGVLNRLFPSEAAACTACYGPRMAMPEQTLYPSG